MNWQGLVIVLLTMIFVAGQIVAHRWIKKVTSCYFFWLGVGAFCFIWLMVFRFANQFSTFWNIVSTTGFTDPGSYDQSVKISSGLLLDICPLCGFLMPILCMVDPSRKAAKHLAPVSLVAGAITIASFIGDDVAVLTAQFIFTGDSVNPCYFIMHFFQIVLAVGIMLNTPRFTWKGLLVSLGCSALLYTYVGICKSITGARWMVSGLDYNDWLPGKGEYHFVAEILHIPYKVCPYIGIPFLNGLGVGFVALKDFVFNKGWFKYGNARNKKIVKFNIFKKEIKMKQWWFWYDYNKFVKQKFI